MSRNEGKSKIPATSVFRGCAGAKNCFIGRLIGGIPGVPEGGLGGGLELEFIGQLTQLFSSGPGGTLGAPGDNSPCPENSGWGNI